MSDTQRLKTFGDQISKQVEAAHAAVKKPIGLPEVAAIVQQVIRSLEGKIPADFNVYAELEALAQTISETRREIAALQPKDISTSHIPLATDELDAVICATEEATNKIMDVCDEIAGIAGECAPALKEKLTACTTKIFEACNFQDITGQRITKVVAALQHIDLKVGGLLRTLGGEAHGGGAQKTVADTDKALLNGPQLPKDAASQDEIDKLMSGQ